jgi:hypothetical protein
MEAFVEGTPLWIRKFFVDFVETGVTALFALNLVIPGSLDVAKAQGLIAGSAILGALICATRRALPDFFAWLRAAFQVVGG